METPLNSPPKESLDKSKLQNLIESIERKEVTALNSYLAEGGDINERDERGQTLLMISVLANNLSATEILLGMGANLDDRDLQHNRSALICASRISIFEIVNLLILSGANLEIVDDQGKTAVIYAVQRGRKEIIRTLVTNGANMEVRDLEGKNALDYSMESLAEEAREESVLTEEERKEAFEEENKRSERCKQVLNGTMQVLSKGAQTDAKKEDLKRASKYIGKDKQGNFEKDIQKSELSRKNKLQNIPSKEGHSKNSDEDDEEQDNASLAGRFKKRKYQDVLPDAKMMGEIKTVDKNIKKIHLGEIKTVDKSINKLLIGKITTVDKHVASINDKMVTITPTAKVPKEEKKEKPPTATSPADLEVEEFFKGTAARNETASSDLNRRSRGGQTLLMFYVLKGNLPKVRELINKGADVKAKDYKGFTSLMLAAQKGHLEIIEELLKTKQEIDLRNMDGFPALAIAVMADQVAAVNLLIKKGARTDVPYKGMTLAMIAASKGSLKVLQQLLVLGEDPFKKNILGKTALDYANANRQDKIVALLKSLQKK